MKVTIIGAGYVGLVSGACLAEAGNEVICVDSDAAKIDMLHAGKVPLYEPGLEDLIVSNVAAGRLGFTVDMKHGVDHGALIFIAVGTPAREDGSADLDHVCAVARSIGETMTDYRIIITKSTVPVGTSRLVAETIATALDVRGVTLDYSVVSNPEFLKEGAAVADFMRPDRIIVGTDDDRALELLRALYAPFNRNHDRLIAMDIISAEMTKYAANAMLATRISFMSEMAHLAERLGADIEAVRIGIGADPRIGYAFIYPGCGYGGSCLPKDVRALHRTAAAVGYEARLLGAVEAINQAQKMAPVNKLIACLGEQLEGCTIALWGLAFKPDTDDMREAPSRTVMEAIWQRGGIVQAFDPVASDAARRIYGMRDELKLFGDDPYQALENADALVVVTEWRVLRGADLNRVAATMKGNIVIDGRNIFTPDAVRQAGLIYHGIGRH